MIGSLLAFEKTVDINKLLNMEEEMQATPFLFSLKGLNGEYLDANKTKLDYFGFKKLDGLLGLTDFDLNMTEQQANHLRTNDKKIVSSAKANSFLERCTIQETTIHCISYKTPLRLGSNKIIGSTCAAFFLPDNTIVSKKYIPILSKQQNICLSLLAQGMTTKEIAKQMRLSPRTVDHYIETIKDKLNCNTRSKLIKIFQSW